MYGRRRRAVGSVGQPDRGHGRALYRGTLQRKVDVNRGGRRPCQRLGLNRLGLRRELGFEPRAGHTQRRRDYGRRGYGQRGYGQRDYGQRVRTQRTRGLPGQRPRNHRLGCHGRRQRSRPRSPDRQRLGDGSLHGITDRTRISRRGDQGTPREFTDGRVGGRDGRRTLRQLTGGRIGRQGGGGTLDHHAGGVRVRRGPHSDGRRGRHSDGRRGRASRPGWGLLGTRTRRRRRRGPGRMPGSLSPYRRRRRR